MCFFPFFFPIKNTSAIWSNFENLMYSFLNCSEMNSCTSSLSSLNNGYTFPFFGTNPFLMLIVWPHSFIVGIHSLAFSPKTWIYLWKCSSTSFLASASDFAAFFSSPYISHSFTSFLTSIVLSFIDFFFFFFFFPHSLSSHLLSFSSPFSSLFYFYQPDFPCFGLYCFPHFSGNLVILTSSVLQSISGLWHASHSIPKIMFHFYSLITSISIFFLCSW